MKKHTIDTAESEAQRFLAAVEVWRTEWPEATFKEWETYGNKESGALKRASLDLTRSLAEMRKP